MIVEIAEHFIDTDAIENITNIYTDFSLDEPCDMFKVYFSISYVVVKGGDLKSKRDELIKVWKSGY